jgi:hypothetical protein
LSKDSGPKDTLNDNCYDFDVLGMIV